MGVPGAQRGGQSTQVLGGGKPIHGGKKSGEADARERLRLRSVPVEWGHRAGGEGDPSLWKRPGARRG